MVAFRYMLCPISLCRRLPAQEGEHDTPFKLGYRPRLPKLLKCFGVAKLVAFKEDFGETFCAFDILAGSFAANFNMKDND